MGMVRIAAAAALYVALVGAADAQSVEKRPDGTVEWKAGINGVTLEFNPAGGVRRIYSKYSHPVTIADKRGVHTATVIAEEKAKGEIVRFLEQDVASGRVVNEFENTVSKTTQEKAGDGRSISTVDQRTIGQSLTELSSSMASGTLSGVVVLESGYDEKEQEAWVVVGLSEKSMSAAQATRDMLKEKRRPAPSGTGPGPATTAGRGPAEEAPRSVIRRGNTDF
ncbi:hypothetical protein H0176_22180 [Methylorubrum populi]|uniref:hypothetical protein n=1 Tax=Methylorubrum rhodesianum TaxID=29427 RepID=UPI00190A66D6|nr:hypothetical protein [Methylorubrum rhodesianum]MBK3404169.1 hypothetical protein [Methylorubrum rhodesianum]MBY0142959.1 hypothetical protein [Methylorubrum populi]